MATQDFQLMQPRQLRDSARTVPVSVADVTPPLVHIQGALQRQWRPLLVAVLASGIAASFVSAKFSNETVTAHLTLASQDLPGAHRGVYEPPNATAASTLIKSTKVLQPVIQKHGLASVAFLARVLKLVPDRDSGTLVIDLVLNDSKKSVDTLNDVGHEFVKTVMQNRKDILTSHAEHVNSLLLTLVSDLQRSRNELRASKNQQDVSGKSNPQISASLEGLFLQKNELKKSLELDSRKVAKLQRELDVLATEVLLKRDLACRQVLEGRWRQSEILAGRVTAAAPIMFVIKEIQRQLIELQRELRTPPKKGDELVIAAPTDAQLGLDETSDKLQSPLTHWVKKVADIGKDTLGNLDAATHATLHANQVMMEALENNVRILKIEAADFKAEQNYARLKLEETDAEIQRIQEEEADNASSGENERESELTQKELQYSRLQQQLHEINQLKDCQMSDYIVRTSAEVDEKTDIKSNWKKLFALVFLGCGLLLASPSMVIELLRLQPSPVDVISRRWNLPVLGVQARKLHVSAGRDARISSSQQELRLMALRIQQSLFLRHGRVVLVSGLDHHQSPMDLIRSLAICFSQREESVLIIETLPCQPETNWVSNSHEKHNPGLGRLGVAEFLAGDDEDARNFVVSTGLPGIEFLPGGSRATTTEAMASKRLTSLIDQCRESYSIILLCGPSTLQPADVQMLAARADGILFTVNRQSMQNVYGEKMIGDFIELGFPILGFTEQQKSAKTFPEGSIVGHDVSHPKMISASS